MTAYAVSTTTSLTWTPGTAALPPIFYTLSPGSFEIKVLQVEYTLTAVNSGWYNITPMMRFAPTMYRYASGTASSGTTVTPVALRQGSASASTTSRWGTGVSVSGTQVYVASPAPISAVRYTDVGLKYTFPADFTVSPGGVVMFSTGGIAGTGAGDPYENSCRVQVIFFFEEYKLAW